MKVQYKYALGVLAAFVMIMAALFLAGGIFMIMLGIFPIGHMGFGTWLTYFEFYGRSDYYFWKLMYALLGGFTIVTGISCVIAFRYFNQERSLHGEARFANAREVFGKKSPLNIKGDGILVGRFKGKYISFGGAQFVILGAPTRSGKGVGFVIPNLLTYKDSCVVLDIKQENFNISSKYRQFHGQDVFLFNPFAEDYKTHRYNPLGYVRDGDFRVADLNAIGQILYPGGGKDPFFDDQARNLFVGLGLYLCETPELPRTIGEMLRQSSGKGQSVQEYLADIIETRKKSASPLSEECVDALNRFIGFTGNTGPSILGSFTAPLGIFSIPIVDASTSPGALGLIGDFNLEDIRRHRMTIYIGITPNYLGEAARLVNLLFSQLVALNTKKELNSTPDLKYRCLMLMDEFTSIGYIGILDNAIGYIASFGLRPLTIIQSMAQLEKDMPRGYGKEGARTLFTNHACQVLYAPKEQRDAEDYSKMLGNETVCGF